MSKEKVFDIANFINTGFAKPYRKILKDDLNYNFIVMKGSSFSGKSYHSAKCILYKLSRYKNFNCRFFATSDDNARTTGHNQYMQCIKATPEFEDLFFYSESLGGRSSMRITSKITGSYIEFKGFISVDDSLKSNADISCYIFEEANRFKEEDVLSALRYARGNPEFNGDKIKPFIMLMLNPVECWIKKYFFDTPRLDTLLIETNWRDNVFLDEAKRQTLEIYRERHELYPTDINYKNQYLIYYVGEWASVQGIPIFNTERINYFIEKYNEKYAQKYEIFYSETSNGYESKKDDNGLIEIYKHPEPGTVYICGYDTRDDTSNEQNDYGVGIMINGKTKEIVAMYRQNTLNSIENENMLYNFLKYYNYAWFIPEVNKHSEYLVSNMVYKGTYDNYIKYKGKYGVYMEKKSKPECLNLIQKYIESIDVLQNKELLEELRTYENKNHGQGAKNGKHDDTVMALGVVLYILDKELIDLTSPRLYEPQKNNIIVKKDNSMFGLDNVSFNFESFM